MRKSRKNLKILVGNLSYGYRLFLLNKDLHDKVKNGYYNNFKEVWDTILVSLEILYWLELAKIFDKYKSSKKSRKVISVHDFFKNYKTKFKGCIRKISKIINLRHKAIAHTNQSVARNWTKFLKELGLEPNDALVVFKRTIDVMDELGNQYKLGKLKSYFDKEELDIQNKADQFIKYSDRDRSV